MDKNKYLYWHVQLFLPVEPEYFDILIFWDLKAVTRVENIDNNLDYMGDKLSKFVGNNACSEVGDHRHNGRSGLPILGCCTRGSGKIYWPQNIEHRHTAFFFESLKNKFQTKAFSRN